jgi:hypothetical protein
MKGGSKKKKSASGAPVPPSELAVGVEHASSLTGEGHIKVLVLLCFRSLYGFAAVWLYLCIG